MESELKGFQKEAVSVCPELAEKAAKLPETWPNSLVALVSALVEAGVEAGAPAREMAKTLWEFNPNAAGQVGPQQPAQTAQPDLTSVLEKMAQLQNEGFVRLGQTLTDAQTMQNFDICANVRQDGSVCGFRLPKGYKGDTCPGCGMSLLQTVSVCGLCGTEVPAEVKGAKFCVGCNMPLLDGDQLQAAKYLIKNGVAQIDVPERLAKPANPQQFQDWVKKGKQITGFVVVPNRQVRSVADAANSFRSPEFLASAARSLDISLRYRGGN